MFAELASSAINAGLGAWQSAKNISMQRETNALNYRMFQEQQDYDRPVNQVGRLKDAGLNPALMYGTGSGANTSPNPIRAEAPRGDAPQFRDPGIAVALQQSRLLSEQARGLKLENDLKDPKKGAPPGTSGKDSAPVREIRKGVEAFKNSELGKNVGPTLQMMKNKGTSKVLGEAAEYWFPKAKKFWDEGKRDGFFFSSPKGGKK